MSNDEITFAGEVTDPVGHARDLLLAWAQDPPADTRTARERLLLEALLQRIFELEETIREITEPWGPDEDCTTLVEPVRMARIWHQELARLSAPGAEARRRHVGALLQVIDGLRETNRRLNRRCQEQQSDSSHQDTCL